MKGVILAAGEGSRIRKVTYGAFPKELLPIGNVPTIRFPLEALRLAEITNVLVVIAPQTKHGIIDGLQSGRRFGMNICYAIQERGKMLHTGIGAAVLTARGWAGKEDFVVALGDSIVCDFSSGNPLGCLRPLIDAHTRNDSIATVLVYPTKADPRRFGVAKFRDFHEVNGTMLGELERMVEKPDPRLVKSFRANGYYYIVAGYYAFKPQIFSYIEKTEPGARNELQITDAMELAIEDDQRVSAVVHADCRNGELFPREYWDVGIPRAYKEANRRLSDENVDKWLKAEG